MAIRQPRYPKEEAARRGDEIYEQDIRPKVGAQDHGKYVAIDIETRQWEMDADEMAAGNRLRGRIPDGADLDDPSRLRLYSPLRRREFAEAGVISGVVVAKQGPVVPLILRDVGGGDHALPALSLTRVSPAG